MIRKSNDLILMLGSNETVEHLAMASSIRGYGHVLNREDGHVFRRGLVFNVDG